MGAAAALLDGGVGVAAADVGVLAPPDEDPPVVVAAVAAPSVAGAAAAAGAAAGAAAAAPKLKLGTNSIAFTFSVENLAATSVESLSWAIFLALSP